MLPGEPAWMYLSFNPRRCGTMMAIDGKETWLIHNFLYLGEPDYDSVDRDWSIRNILGVGPDFEYEVISKKTGSGVAWSLIASKTGACSSAAMRRISGSRTPGTA